MDLLVEVDVVIHVRDHQIVSKPTPPDCCHAVQQCQPDPACPMPAKKGRVQVAILHTALKNLAKLPNPSCSTSVKTGRARAASHSQLPRKKTEKNPTLLGPA